MKQKLINIFIIIMIIILAWEITLIYERNNQSGTPPSDMMYLGETVAQHPPASPNLDSVDPARVA